MYRDIEKKFTVTVTDKDVQVLDMGTGSKIMNYLKLYLVYIMIGIIILIIILLVLLIFKKKGQDDGAEKSNDEQSDDDLIVYYD